MRKTLLFLFIILFISACQSNTPKDDKEENSSKVTLTIRNPKIEIASAFEEMIQAYEKEHPYVKIEVTTVGGALDDFSDLKAQIAAEEGPDIFTNPGYSSTELWMPYLEDLSDQPWVKNAYPETLEAIKMDGHVYGMPMNLEGYGFIYNKELFKEAGIEKLPSTFTELKSITKQLEQAGITPFATGYYEKWKLGDHLMNIAISQQENPDLFIKKLKDGTTSIENNQIFKQLIELLDLTIEHGGEDPLSTDYTMELQQFTSEKAAMMLQGNWIQPMINKFAPDMQIGIFPITLNEKAEKNTLSIHTPSYWVVNQQTSAEKKEEAKRFLNWMVNSEQGQKFMVEKLRFIPAFKHVDIQDTDPLTSKITELYQANRTLSSNWSDLPAGLREAFGTDTQQYIEHEWSKTQLLQAYQNTWDEIH
ncbi:raffinose/stachyose/melibiose transport system substrate-binding protein [Gracilibacillus orientalis]|uniref:Raffinose/stachyose/melibiose transport system substrate-binding protein n=1 Tax=Gracilibacillus orientalis TaxID=334253 RepID=A0A1I4NEG9_9BACI|nr:extracellular solute-binding protein [Gracilibacillus orientalis]SFM13901.1 raffinose/stachyose/melibiose transport system substrate-binding protein [Gracilibacillus orientalis]